LGPSLLKNDITDWKIRQDVVCHRLDISEPRDLGRPLRGPKKV
jgi:hypothetical protein